MFLKVFEMYTDNILLLECACLKKKFYINVKPIKSTHKHYFAKINIDMRHFYFHLLFFLDTT